MYSTPTVEKGLILASTVRMSLQRLVISNSTCFILTMAKSHSLAIFAMQWVPQQVYARLTSEETNSNSQRGEAIGLHSLKVGNVSVNENMYTIKDYSIIRKMDHGTSLINKWFLVQEYFGILPVKLGRGGFSQKLLHSVWDFYTELLTSVTDKYQV